MIKKSPRNMLLATVATLSVLACFGQSRLSSADESSSDTRPSTHSHKKDKVKAFKLGVCVGQALVEDGIRLSPSEMKKESLDSATKKTLKKEIKECKAELKKAFDSSSSDSNEPSDTEDEEDSGF